MISLVMRLKTNSDANHEASPYNIGDISSMLMIETIQGYSEDSVVETLRSQCQSPNFLVAHLAEAVQACLVRCSSNQQSFQYPKYEVVSVPLICSPAHDR